MEQLIIMLLGHGPIGFVAAIALWFAWKKDQEVKKLYGRMISREEKRAQWVHEIFSEVNQTVRMLQANQVIEEAEGEEGEEIEEDEGG